MATRKKSPTTFVPDAPHATDSDATEVLDIDTELAPAPTSDLDASLCATCGEPLVWHEEACSATAPAAAPESRPTRFTLDAPPEADPGLTPRPFAYALGQTVQPTPDAPVHTIVWRGQVKARHPRLGLIHRVNVYRLDNGYWDCYYETDLRAA
ncbi:hypothetical protein MUN82_08350 [Hymenobacter aerilatus]|uniref:Uncharacterized protein n=1 Tax=Hymenobacter aerilatus TaxID=2932251 RepID=A0A8T9SYE7_9BACT|nr:hypothetical protein [Hymenobacter aerilatus]UOR07098.1 hypothetical protein MUN82_08350 [Hymenobacter aerilatus]